MPPVRGQSSRPRHALLVGSEVLPFSKSGGLADVLGALPPALARQGWEVTVVSPRYRGVDAGTFVDRVPISLGGRSFDVGFYDAPMADGARALLIDVPELFDREGLYHVRNVDYADNARRFAVLSKAALEWAAKRGQPLGVVHAHDWQAGLVPVYLRTHYAQDHVLAGTPAVFTIHNMAYQGLFEPDWLPRLDLPWDLFAVERMEFWGRISFLKGAINDANLITTVSRTYAQEIQTVENGFGFEGILSRRAGELVGILNGIDVASWDPASDPHLPAPYSLEDLSGKRQAKVAVLSRYGLEAGERTLDRPLIGMISRMVDQKGLDLIAASAEILPELDATFLVLGTGEARYQDMWRSLAARHPDRIGVVVGFDEGLAHLIEGGADAFLMPSRYEPCGLNQMYSLRYGTVPIVRATGGLADTVVDYAPRRRSATGIVFRDYTSEALVQAIRRAIELYRQPRIWHGLQVAGMKQDHSWDQSAREYVKIYDRLCRTGGTGRTARTDLTPGGAVPRTDSPRASAPRTTSNGTQPLNEQERQEGPAKPEHVGTRGAERES
jgi:starch synthase